MEAARQCAKHKKECKARVHMCLNEFHEVIFVWPSFFLTALPCSGGYHLERGGMPLYDVVGINCKLVQLLKIKVQVSSICAKQCMLEDCVCVI